MLRHYLTFSALVLALAAGSGCKPTTANGNSSPVADSLPPSTQNIGAELYKAAPVPPMQLVASVEKVEG